MEDLFAKIANDGGIEIVRKANSDNTLYAKVDEHDIVEKIKEIYQIEVEPFLFKLKKKLEQGSNKTFGMNSASSFKTGIPRNILKMLEK